MKSALAPSLLAIPVLAAISLGGCETVRAVEQAGMLGPSLLATVLGAALLGVMHFAPRSDP